MTDAGIVDLYSYLMGGMTGELESAGSYTPLAYPIAIPSRGIRSLTWGKFETIGRSVSPFTRHRVDYRHQGEGWMFSVSFGPMRRELVDEWEAFILLCGAGAGTVLFGDITRAAPRGLAYGSPKVDGGAQTGRTLLVKGWQQNVTGILKAGDFIQLGNRLHKVLRDANSDADGNCTLDIWPRLRESPSNDLEVVTANARGVFRINEAGGALGNVDFSYIYSLPTLTFEEDLF